MYHRDFARLRCGVSDLNFLCRGTHLASLWIYLTWSLGPGVFFAWHISEPNNHATWFLTQAAAMSLLFLLSTTNLAASVYSAIIDLAHATINICPLDVLCVSKVYLKQARDDTSVFFLLKTDVLRSSWLSFILYILSLIIYHVSLIWNVRLKTS